MSPLKPDPSVALLIVDVQNAMDAPVWGERNNPDLIPNLRSVLDRWRELGLPVYWVADDSTNPDSPYYPGQPGNEFKEELSPTGGERVVRKNTGSAFAGTALEETLRQSITGLPGARFPGRGPHHRQQRPCP